MSGCGTTLRQEPPPAVQTEGLAVLGIPNARFWLDSDPAPLMREGGMMVRRQAAALPASSGACRRRISWRCPAAAAKAPSRPG